MQYDVVLITEDRYVHPQQLTDYISNILLDDTLLTNALEKHGLKVKRVSWSDPDFDWSTTRCAMFRTTWDYFIRFDAFMSWFNKTRTQTKLLNDPATVEWNLHKQYLLDLEAAGIAIVPTTFLRKNETVSLDELFIAHNADQGIIKPAVSGSARNTFRVQKDNAQQDNLLQTLLQDEDMLFQPFQQAIIDNGEVSLMVMHGKYTHAVLKTAKAGDFRVQDDHGGTVHPYTPTASEIAFAEQAVRFCPTLPLYARVDIVVNNGIPYIMELELIEPELWFRKAPEAAVIFADGLYQYLSA